MAVFRVEKTKDFTIMCNHHLRNTELSLKAKGLLSLMLSLPEDWDYTTKGLAHICKDGVDSITTALKELERHGYLTRQRLRYENGQLGDIEYTIHEKPVNAEKQGDSPKRENPRQANPGQAKPEQGEPGQGNPAQLNTNPLKTKKSKTDISRTHPSIYPSGPEAAGRSDGMDRIELADAYREILKENIEYGCMVSRYGKERLDETVELMLEVVLSKRPYIRIAGDDFPREVVKGRFLKINSGHLEYVFDCIDRNTTKVGNIKAYLLAALYNAPATMPGGENDLRKHAESGYDAGGYSENGLSGAFGRRRRMKIKLIDFGVPEDRRPFRPHGNDADADVYMPYDCTLQPGEIAKVPLGFGIEVPDGYAGYVFPRTSMAVKGLVCELPPVDSGYRGEIHAIISNVSSQTQELSKGSRVGQLVITPVVIADFVTELGEQRGTDGFGSTGK